MTCLPTSFPHWEKITPGDNNSRALPHLPLLSQESCNTQKKLLGREIQVLTQEAVTVDEICASKFRRPWGVQKVKGQSLMVSDLPLSSVQSLSHVRLFATPWTAARQASLSIINSWSPPKCLSIKLVMPCNHLILRLPLLLMPSIFPNIMVFSNESALHIRWPKYWSFSLNISPSKEHPGLMSFRMDWLDLLAVQGIFKSLLQHHSSKASILWCSAFLTVELSHPYMTTGKTIALTRWAFLAK